MWWRAPLHWIHRLLWYARPHQGTGKSREWLCIWLPKDAIRALDHTGRRSGNVPMPQVIGAAVWWFVRSMTPVEREHAVMTYLKECEGGRENGGDKPTTLPFGSSGA